MIVFSCVQLFVLQTPDASAVPASPTKWVRYANNPILSQGPAGAWDAGNIMAPDSVVQEGNELFLYYHGSNGPVAKIGMATSSDGVIWTKYNGNPIIDAGPAGSWDDSGVVQNTVIKDGSTFKMWYAASDGTYNRIGYATSSDGKSWTKYASNPVMDVGGPGAFDRQWTFCPYVLRENGIYKMWYAGSDGSSTWRIGYAESNDGLNWTKYAYNPVLNVGGPGAWDSAMVITPRVLNISGSYKMWYTGHPGDHDSIGYATSPDGKSWTKYPYNPIMAGTGSGWEQSANTHPVVLYNGTTYRMWYGGVQSSYIWRFGYAEGQNPNLHAPILISPADNSWTNISRPSFSWSFNDTNPRDTEAGYQIQLSASADFGAASYDSGRVASTSTSHAPASALPDGLYYWRVRVWTADDEMSDWSLTRKMGIDTVPPQLLNIQISGVTGDVIDIGLIRMHLMEVSSGAGAKPTGRVVAFSNGVVFQPDAAIFKQIPGTSFIWHEVSLTLGPESNYQSTEKRMLEAVNTIFADYQGKMEMQRSSMERALTGHPITDLNPESRLRLVPEGIQVIVRYPVEIESAAAIDDRVTREVLSATGQQPKLSLEVPASEATPAVSPATKK